MDPDGPGSGGGAHASHGNAPGIFGDGVGSGGEALLRALSTDMALASAGGRSATGVYREVWGRLPSAISDSGSGSVGGGEMSRGASHDSATGMPGLVLSSLSVMGYHTPADDIDVHATLKSDAAYESSRSSWHREQVKQLKAKRAKEAVKRELARLVKCRDLAGDVPGGSAELSIDSGTESSAVPKQHR